MKAIKAITVGFDETGWLRCLLPTGTGVSVNAIRWERDSPGRQGRIVIEASPPALEEMGKILGIAPCEAPPLHEIEQRLSRLEAAAKAVASPELASLQRGLR